jgi:RHS repeat-associated protein
MPQLRIYRTNSLPGCQAESRWNTIVFAFRRLPKETAEEGQEEKPPAASPAFYQRNPWRQVIVTALAGAVLVTSIPTPAYAGTPVYDPVFYYYHPDHLGSSQLMTDRDGDVVQRYGYSPFGREDYKNNSLAFSVSNRYTGQTLDEDTGLYYYGARYYDPELARFIQADSRIPSASLSQAYNRYAYCYNNPLKLSDPTGQNPLIIAAIIGAIQGAASAKVAGGDCEAVLKGALKGAVIGAITGLISAGVAEAVGQVVAVGTQSAVIGSVAGTVAGFGASYAMRGAMSGDWHFTLADAVNLAIAVWAACLQNPSPGANDSIEETHERGIQAAKENAGPGGSTSDDLDLRKTWECIQLPGPPEAAAIGPVSDAYEPVYVDGTPFRQDWRQLPTDPVDLNLDPEMSSHWTEWQLEYENAILDRHVSVGMPGKDAYGRPVALTVTRSFEIRRSTLSPWSDPGPGVDAVVPGLTKGECIWQRRLVPDAGGKVIRTEWLTTKGYLRATGDARYPWMCDARYKPPGRPPSPPEFRRR